MTLSLGAGDVIFPSRLPIRLLASAWCLTAAVLVAAYSSLLTTYLLTPNDAPLINSIYDITKNPDYKLILQEGRSFDIFLSVKRATFPH